MTEQLRTRWIRSSKTTSTEPLTQVAGVEAVDTPQCSSPRPLSSIDHFRHKTAKAPLPTPQSPTMIEAATKKRTRAPVE